MSNGMNPLRRNSSSPPVEQATHSCRCEEKKKRDLSSRNWSVFLWLPYKVWGPKAHNYNERLMLDFSCLSCGARWRNKNISSPVWDLIKVDPKDIRRRGEQITLNKIES